MSPARAKIHEILGGMLGTVNDPDKLRVCGIDSSL
jgi:hypothetical protein